MSTDYDDLRRSDSSRPCVVGPLECAIGICGLFVAWSFIGPLIIGISYWTRNISSASDDSGAIGANVAYVAYALYAAGVWFGGCSITSAVIIYRKRYSRWTWNLILRAISALALTLLIASMGAAIVALALAPIPGIGNLSIIITSLTIALVTVIINIAALVYILATASTSNALACQRA